MRLLEAELSTLRPLTSPLADYSDETLSELAVLRAAATASALYGPRAIDTYVISKTTGVSDLLEAYVLMKEVGLFAPGDPARSPVLVAPLFETIADLQAAPATMRALPGVRADPRAPDRPRRPGDHDRLLGLATRTAATSPRSGRCTRRSAS